MKADGAHRIKLSSEIGIAYDREEYIEALIAVAVPLKTYREDLQAAIWAVGLKQEFREDLMMGISKFLRNTVEEINDRFSMVAGHFSPNNETPNGEKANSHFVPKLRKPKK